MRTSNEFCSLRFRSPPTKIEKKVEVVLNDFYSFASASLLFISLLFSLSPTAALESAWFSEVFVLVPLRATLCLSLAFFRGLPWVADGVAAFLGLERGTVDLSAWEVGDGGNLYWSLFIDKPVRDG